jgi:aminopeptidase N
MFSFGEDSMRRSLAALFLCFLSLCWFYTDRCHAQTPPVEKLQTAGDRPIDIKHIRLDLTVDLPKKTVDAKATLTVRSLRPISNIDLDAVDFEVKSVSIKGGKNDKEVPAHYSHDGKKLFLDLDPAWAADQESILVIDYRIRDPKAGLYFFGPTKAEPNVPLTVWSQGESITNRYWIPCLDHPNQKQTTELVVTVADGFDVLSNGKLLERKKNNDNTVTYHWLQDKPHVSYLVTLVVGKFDIAEEKWKNVPVRYYVPKGHKEEIARTFGRTPEMIELFSKLFGVDYPWDQYAQVVAEQFTAGGMENTSATTLTDYALHDERSMLDSSPDGLIAHELGHQWWGDLLTCRDWSHLWLNEGFASYCEVLWDEHKEGKEEAQLNLFHKAGAAIGGGKDRPVVDRKYPFPDAMFDGRSYPKGAWVLNMLRKKLGDDVFFKCLQKYLTDFRYQSVDSNDFRRTIERVTGRNLERFFYDWTERAGSPVVEINTEYQPETKQVRLTVKQTQAGDSFHFPLKVAFTTGNGTAKVQNLEEEVREKEQVFFFPLSERPTMVEVDPDQTVLGEIKENKSRELWLSQLTKAQSVPARIRAAQHFGQSKEVADREALAKALKEEKFYGVQQEIASALGESGGDVSRDALIDGLKDKNPKVRRSCVDHLGKFRKDEKAIAAVKDVLAKGDPSYNVEATAISSYARLQPADTVSVIMPWLAKPSHRDTLRDSALQGLGNSQDLSVIDTLIEWTKRGKPRSCRSSALRALGQLAQKGNPTEEQRTKIVKAVAECLEGEQPVVLNASVSVLRDLGRSASTSLPALEAIKLHDPNDRVRELAKTAIEQIHKNEQAPVEITRLREEIETLKKTQESLKEQLQKYEKKDRKEAPQGK